MFFWLALLLSHSSSSYLAQFDSILIPQTPLDSSLSEVTACHYRYPFFRWWIRSSSSSRDFSIAFVVAPPKRLWKRISSAAVKFRSEFVISQSFYSSPSSSSVALLRNVWRCGSLTWSCIRRTVTIPDGSGFHFFGDTPALLYPNFIINEVERTIRFTLVRSPHRLFSCSLIQFLNLFLGFWHWTFFPTLLLIIDFSELYTQTFDTNVIGHLLLFVKLCCVSSIWLVVHLAWISQLFWKVARAGADSPQIVNTISAILDEVRRSSLTRRLSLTSPSSYLCSTKILPPSTEAAFTSDNEKDKNKWRNVGWLLFLVDHIIVEHAHPLVIDTLNYYLLGLSLQILWEILKSGGYLFQPDELGLRKARQERHLKQLSQDIHVFLRAKRLNS